MRTIILYKINNDVVCEEHEDNTIEHIEKMRGIIAEECDCSFDDVSIEKIDSPIDQSEYDIDTHGIVGFKDLYLTPRMGIACVLKEGGDAYLDAIIDGTIGNYLYFFSE